MLGTFGEVVVETSSQLIRTFDGFKRTQAARWATHDRIGLKPLIEYTGPQAVSVSFEMNFSVEMGVHPLGEIQTLQGHLDAGDHCELILDGRYFGDFVIESLNEEWTRLDNRGGLLAARVSVSLKEYAPWPQA